MQQYYVLLGTLRYALSQKVELSTIFYRLEIQNIGALFTKISTPVCEQWVDFRPVWSTSTNVLVITELPLMSGTFTGTASSVSR